MALVSRAKMPQVIMLKDYLDDLSSCSSNGFKSFPRRQCCTPLRLPLHKQTSSSSNYRLRPPLKPPPPSRSALQKASQVLLNAVKLLPFPSLKPQPRRKGSGSGRLLLLQRSLSKRLVKEGLWGKKKKKKDGSDQCNIERWRSFQDKNDVDRAKTTSLKSTTSDTESNGNSCWADNLPSPSTSSNSGVSGENKLLISEGKSDFQQHEQVNDGVGVPVGNGDDASKEVSSSDEGKEQFSPVSVLDCPFDDESDDSSSPNFHHHLINGTNHELIQKLRRVNGGLSDQLQPLDLQKRLALSDYAEEEEDDDEEPCSVSQPDNTSERLQFFFRSGFKLKGSDKLLLDFITEKLDEGDLFSEAEDWVSGGPKNLILGCEVTQGRERFLKEMDKDGRWADLGLQRKELEAQLEKDVLSFLVDDLLADIFDV